MHTVYFYSPVEVNKYSTFIFLTRSVSGPVRQRWLSEAETLQEDSAPAAGKSYSPVRLSITRLKLRVYSNTAEENQSRESDKVQGRRGGGQRWSVCSYLVLAVPRSISSLSHRTTLERGNGRGGPVEVRTRSELTGRGDGGGRVKDHRAVEVIFLTPLRWARVEQPTGSRTGGTFLLRAE